VARPDLILFVTDQQRHDQVGFASDGHFETPNLDRLAASGVIFDNAYSASTTCVPARTALLTGLHPHRLPTQINRFALREGFWTIARALRDAGYETALIGKMHFVPVHADHGFETMRLCEHLNAQGFLPAPGDDERDESRDDRDDYHEWLLENGHDDWRFDHGELIANLRNQPFRGAPGTHPTDWIERETREFLDRRERDRPLFLVVSFPHPHAPYNPPEPYASMYDPAEPAPPTTDFTVNEALPPIFRDAMSSFGGIPPHRTDPDDPRPLQRQVAWVRGLVKQIDDALGRIVDQLDLAESVVFFTSDHGDYAGNRGLLKKKPWIPYDDLARVALVVAGCGIEGGRRVGELVQSCDFALTALDFADVAIPAGVEFSTRSLRPFLVGTPDPHAAERSVFCQTNIAWSMIRRGRYKCLVSRPWGVAVLFDVVADPEERHPLDDPESVRITAELRRILDEELSLGIPDLPSNL